MCKRCLEAACGETISGDADFSPFNKSKAGYVYFFSVEDLSRIKIGYSRISPFTRMKLFQSDECQKLVMIAVYPVPHKRVERNLHKFFARQRIDKRREWFRWEGRMCAVLKEMWLAFHCGMTIEEVEEAWGCKISGLPVDGPSL